MERSGNTLILVGNSRLMKKKGVRIKQQALASKSLEFVAEEYLPRKIENGVLLP